MAGGPAITHSPLFADLLRQLEAPGPDTAARRVELQERLSEVNLLSNVFTRTKRRDVEINVSQREALTPFHEYHHACHHDGHGKQEQYGDRR